MNILSKKITLIIFFLIFISDLRSQDKDNPWVIGFGVNAVDFYPTNIHGMKSEAGNSTKWFDQFFNLNDHYNYISAPSKLSIGRYLNESFSVELAGSINKIKKLGSIKLDKSISYYAIDANINYNINKIIGKTSWFDPYAIMGGGFNAKTGNSNGLPFKNYGSFNSGVGSKIWLYKKLGVKIQTIYKHFFNDGSYPHFQHSASIIYKFGGYDEDNDGVFDKDDVCPDVFGLVEFKGCPDSDEDGVPDSEDNCLNVYGSVKLNGCPDSDEDGVTDELDNCPYIKGEIKHNGCPDTDGDGIIDQRDGCPTVAGPLSNNGCPEPDTDGDGVIDRLDKCKFETGPADNNGCPVVIDNNYEELEAKLVELARGILFVSGSDKFYTKNEDQLNQIAGLMNDHNDLKFQIQGHTDSVGSEETNLQLSIKRINKVVNYLVSQGVDKSNLSTKGFGESMPIATNDTAEGRTKNRRIEIKIVN
ncbi:OmpA family protein [Lutibacter sp. B1]|uniref:OmpA family protein n=1 Tax=Lutibacter sp. B1 TaxID=2725996 RepID=UPI0014570031|nr:OmpA family protein [Lutibacter sp. B1]NLP57072.1 OmpA family protein [Lutibacter sp. B1]